MTTTAATTTSDKEGLRRMALALDSGLSGSVVAGDDEDSG